MLLYEVLNFPVKTVRTTVAIVAAFILSGVLIAHLVQCLLLSK